MHTNEIVREIILQGKILCDRNIFKANDFTTDAIYFKLICDSSVENAYRAEKVADAYYKNEDYIHEILERYYLERR